MKIKKLFGEINMTWPKVLLLAVFSAVLTAGLNLIPKLSDTSFTDMAVNLDVWFLYALIIIMNCKNMKEAALKTFVFFLISQPLIYLIEVPFVNIRWDIFHYYKYWFIVTLLTIPGAAIAYLIKKQNWLSVAILSVANGYLAYMCARYTHTVASSFPRHILSAAFCLGLAICFALLLLDDKKKKLVELAFIAVVLIVSFVSIFNAGKGNSATIRLSSDGQWTYKIEAATSSEDFIDVEVGDGGFMTINSNKNGSCILTFTNEKGEEEAYTVLVNGKNMSVSEIN